MDKTQKKGTIQEDHPQRSETHALNEKMQLLMEQVHAIARLQCNSRK